MCEKVFSVNCVKRPSLQRCRKYSWSESRSELRAWRLFTLLFLVHQQPCNVVLVSWSPFTNQALQHPWGLVAVNVVCVVCNVPLCSSSFATSVFQVYCQTLRTLFTLLHLLSLFCHYLLTFLLHLRVGDWFISGQNDQIIFTYRSNNMIMTKKY